MNPTQKIRRNLKVKLTPKLRELLQNEIDAELKKISVYYESQGTEAYESNLDFVERRILNRWQKKSHAELKRLDSSYVGPKSTRLSKTPIKAPVEEQNFAPSLKVEQDFGKKSAEPDYKGQNATALEEKEREDESRPIDAREWVTNAIDDLLDQAVEAVTKTTTVKDNKHLLSIKSKAIKKVLRDVQSGLDNARKRYRVELEFSRSSKYPLGWMKRDRWIAAVIDHYPLLCGILNFIFQDTRYVKQEDINAMALLVDGQQHNGFDLACFKADSRFYGRLAKAVERSERTVKRYVTALVKLGALRELKRTTSNIRIYSDGYYRITPEGFRAKQPWIKESTEWKQKLRSFTITDKQNKTDKEPD